MLTAHYPGPTAYLPLATAIEHVGFRPVPEPLDVERWEIYKRLRIERAWAADTGGDDG